MEIAGNQLHEPERKFKEVLISNPDALDKYRPSDDCGEFNEFFFIKSKLTILLFVTRPLQSHL